MGGTVSSRSARKGSPRCPCRTCSATQIGACPCDLRQVGRDGVPAVCWNIGRRGLRPSQRAFAAQFSNRRGRRPSWAA